MAAAGPEEAEDCFQETFLAALRAYPKLRDGHNLKCWVLTIATRKAIDASRSRRRRPVSVPDVAAVGEAKGSRQSRSATGVVAEGPHAAGGLAPTDPYDPLWESVRRLPARQRAAVVQRFVLDRSYGEIAATMGGSEEAARANVSLGLGKLRKDLT